MLLLTATQGSVPSLELGLTEICLRFLCAMVVGMVIGTEREYTNRPAGMRTHILVALGACAVMITGQTIFHQYKALGGTPDPSRLAAQVITGVGFLGAGTILREGTNVKGLTTAASLWAVACLGIAAGGGYYAIALVGMVFIFITLTIFEAIQIRLVGPGTSLHSYRLQTADISQGLAALHAHAQKQRAGIRELLTQRQEDETYIITFTADIGGTRSKKRRESFLKNLAADKSVICLHICAEEETSTVI